MTYCTQLFAHSIDKLETVEKTKDAIFKRCTVCGYTEALKHSNKTVIYINDLVHQKKKWAAEDNAKEILQPTLPDGSANPEFTEAYGYNPFDERTKSATPAFQGGSA